MSRRRTSFELPFDVGLWYPRLRVPAICLVLAVITFVVFGQTTDFEFVNYDDHVFYKNPQVANGLSLKGIAWVFTHADCFLYHPLTMISFMADNQFHGVDAGWYHFTNVLLHTASVILLFLVLQQMTGALWGSAFVAAVFAIHPLRAESVAWVAERKDVLSGFFFMLTLGAYARFVRKPDSRARYLMVAAAFVLALLSKPSVVTLPFVLLLLDYWPLHRFEQQGPLNQPEWCGIPRRLILEKIPLLALAAGASVITALVTRGLVDPAVHVSLPARIGNALVYYAVYLRQMIWPAGLAVVYPYPPNGLPAWQMALAGVLLGGLSAAAWAWRRTQPWLLIGWLWYLGMLMPMIGITPAGAYPQADRYTYLPQIGIYLALTWLVAGLRVGRVVFGCLMAGVLAALMVCGWKQTAHWKNSETLWAHALACTTNNCAAALHLGNALDQIGELDEAMIHYREAIKMCPEKPDAYNNLGNDLRQQGKADEAITQYQAALRIKPDNADAHYNLGIAFRQQGKVDEAITQYQAALQINPGHAAAHINLGSALLQKGRVDEAIAHLQKALQLNPGNAQALNNLGTAFQQKGDMPEAIAQYQQAAQLDPSDPWVRCNLAWLLATSSEASLRNGSNAVDVAVEASVLTDGNNPLVLHALAAAYAEAGRFSEAVETAQRALELAAAQSKAGLVGLLQSELKLYQAGRPFHAPPQTH
jgi:protein O-mannosyl-transferase